VRVLVRQDTRAIEGLPLETVRGDVLDPGSLERAFPGAEVVFHLAARISIAGPEDGQVEAINVRGARHVARACVSCGVPRLVHFSSIHALSAEPESEVIDEGRRPAGVEAPVYDRTKAAGEREVLAGVDEGLAVVVVNPTAVIGPWDFKPSAMGEVILGLCRGQRRVLVRGGFNWVDARDVADGAIAAAERGRSGERYLFGGTWLDLADLAGMVAMEMGSRTWRWAAPMWLARLGAPLAEYWARWGGWRPLMTRESLRALRGHRFVSHEKARAELGYQPRPLAETIRDTVAWFRQAVYLSGGSGR
jgi:dihydroflavonol-4-reductase